MDPESFFMSFFEKEKDDKANVYLKVASSIIILIFGVIFGLMPYFIKACRTSTKFLGLANAFSGGVFIGIGLLHLLPEGQEKFKDDEFLNKYPSSYFLAFLAYSLILFIEKVLFAGHSIVEDPHKKKEEMNKLRLGEVQKVDESVTSVDLSKEGIPIGERLIPNSIGGVDESATTDDNKPDAVDDISKEKKPEEHKDKSTNPLTPYILLIALGFHGFFEGLALGLQDEYQGTLFILIAIVAHKWAESLTLGISFVKANSPKNQIISMNLLFSLIGPLGVVAGIFLSNDGNPIVEGIFLGLSTGTFLYVACSEVIVEEFENPKLRYPKFILFLIGGIFTAALSVIEHMGEEKK